MTKSIQTILFTFGLMFFCINITPTQGHDHCQILDLSDVHHHGRTTVCLAQLSKLTKLQLDHFLTSHLENNTKCLKLNYQINLDDSHLKTLAESKLSGRIIRLDLMGTSVTYDGIALLWKSKTLGSVRDDEAVYDQFYNLQVSVIMIEIGHTPALQQYINVRETKQKRIFPLPLRKEFVIHNLSYAGENSQEDTIGFKKIILLNHGEEIE